MRLSQQHKQHDKINYYPLPNDKVDVFLRKNEYTETDEEGNLQYVAEEVYFQVDKSTTKEMIEKDFEKYWDSGGDIEPTIPIPEERLQMVEDTILTLLMGGI